MKFFFIKGKDWFFLLTLFSYLGAAGIDSLKPYVFFIYSMGVVFALFSLLGIIFWGIEARKKRKMIE